jgi:Tol biopolymer transport system component
MRNIGIFLLSGFVISCSALEPKYAFSDIAASKSGKECQIAVVKAVNEHEESIQILDRQGQILKTVTQVGRNWSPSWSANGKYLAFLSDRNITPTAPNEQPGNDPFYHPAGHLFVADLISGELNQITFGTYKSWLPTLSPDGAWVVFLSDQNSKGDLYLSPARHSAVKPLTRDKNWPLEGAIWFSESELVYNAFIGDTLEVFRLNVQDQICHKIELKSPKGSKTGYLSLSHDGKRLAFVTRDRVADRRQGIINPQIFVADLDGRNSRQLTFGESVNYAPSWSSDDKWIAFLRQVDTAAGLRANLYLVDINGRNEQLIATNMTSSPVWLPHENVIVYTSYQDNRSRLFVYDLGGKNVKEIGDSKASYRDPATCSR